MTPDYDIEIDQGTDTERIFNCVDGYGNAATAKTAAEKANGDLTTFKTNIGDTTVDFAAVYTAARDAE